jgi:hypothetical protein
VNAVLLWVVSTAVCPASTPVPNTPGFTAAVKLPPAEAMRLNREGKQLYRQERWPEAREKYRAALATDADFLSAQLNVACSFSRQGRYAEAAEIAATLIRRAFVPWNREVLEAADLGVLQDQVVYAKVRTACAEAAASWGKVVQGGILFVARTKPPLHLAGGGVLALGLNQEIFAWIPETGRYLQVTAEDGHVLAFAASADGRRIAYLLGGKVIRSPGQAALLRGLSARVLDLPTMSLGKAVPIPGDVRSVQLWFSTVPELKVIDASSSAMFNLLNDRLQYAPTAAVRSRADSVELSAAGVEPGKSRVVRTPCGFALTAQKDPAGLWRVLVSRSRRKTFALDARYGAGLGGLPFPDGAIRSSAGLEASHGEP